MVKRILAAGVIVVATAAIKAVGLWDALVLRGEGDGEG